MPLNLNPYGGNNIDGMFPLSYKQVAWVLVPNLAVIFRHRFRGDGSRNVGDQPLLSLPKEFSSSDVGDYRAISITYVLLKVFAHLSHHLQVALLGTIWWAMQMILQSMQLFLDMFRVLK